jgi:hypothetical protein
MYVRVYACVLGVLGVLGVGCVGCETSAVFSATRSERRRRR